MADAPKILGSDTLRIAYPKINKAIDNANEAVTKAITAETDATDAKNLSESVQTQLNTIVMDGDSSPAADQARTDLYNQTLPSLKDRIDKQQYFINVKTYGAVGDGITDDTVSINNAISDAPIGSTIYFPDKGYLVTSDITINKPLTILGAGKPTFDGTYFINGTFLNGGGFLIDSASDVIIRNFGVFAPSVDNGFEIRGFSEDCLIENCSSLTKDHSYLIEEYEGDIQRTVIRNCNSYNAIHGFVTKAKYTTFEDCSAFNHSSNGFVITSDNKVVSTNRSNSNGCVVRNCRTFDSVVGFLIQCRDVFSETNEAGISLENVTLENCKTHNATNGYIFGNGGTPPAGYTYIPIKYLKVINCYETGSTNWGALIQRVTNAVIELTGETRISYARTTCKQVDLKTNADTSGSLTTYHEIETLTVNSGTPSVATGRRFYKTANTTSATITNLVGANDGQVIELIIDDDFTLINDGGNFSLIHGVIRGKGSRVKLFYDGAVWNEISGNVVGKVITQDILSNGTIELKNTNFWDLIGAGGTSKPITFSGRNYESPIITLMIRSTIGSTPMTISFADDIVLPSNFPSQAGFNDRIIATFIFHESLGKWCNISWQSISG